jgi:hypothetical protein
MQAVVNEVLSLILFWACLAPDVQTDECTARPYPLRPAQHVHTAPVIVPAARSQQPSSSLSQRGWKLGLGRARPRPRDPDTSHAATART